ncbi:zona pellucida glycoprotein 3f, tandem duplicate 1 isoform X1 [Sinocyclocheilus grahami]|uniref:zona pellucida glycoprotein 3f, tandem duplicate 1 isoform X1 n=1 Tax=Sinocyclocheilus grahami TaxID=75366 RepID=UPI0007AD6897|nr:PREDICTED: zona pellucida sperm-binding protein 3-like isoform X1 [Sinocyclocheilus grahami]
MVQHIVRMPSFLLFVVLTLAVFLVVQAAVTVDCGKNSVSVRWIDVNSQVDPSLLRLGDCPPTQLSVNPQGSEAVFYAEFLTCNIRRQVTTNEIIFETEITSPTLSKATPIYYPVACAYEREEDWAPPLYDPLLFHTHGQGDLAFRMALMKDDYSGVATTTTFSLGSMIPIAASVAQQNHQPLILLLDECLASTTPELASDSRVYPLITNKGCLVDSKNTNSRFLPRNQLSEIRLSLQAFKFATGEDVYLHCRLVAWEPRDLDSGNKACQYDRTSSRLFLFYRWVLVDDPSQSSLCSCCDTNCQGRKKRGITADGAPSYWRRFGCPGGADPIQQL